MFNSTSLFILLFSLVQVPELDFAAEFNFPTRSKENLDYIDSLRLEENQIYLAEFGRPNWGEAPMRNWGEPPIRNWGTEPIRNWGGSSFETPNWGERPIRSWGQRRIRNLNGDPRPNLGDYPEVPNHGEEVRPNRSDSPVVNIFKSW